MQILYERVDVYFVYKYESCCNLLTRVYNLVLRVFPFGEERPWLGDLLKSNRFYLVLLSKFKSGQNVVVNFYHACKCCLFQ